MGEWKQFNIDIWWKAVLMLGILTVSGASLFQIEFLENRHLFGLGLGLILIGLGFWKSYKTLSQISTRGILSYKIHKHDFTSIFLIVIGILVTGFFGFLLINGLI
ncbi:hypothetical protein EF405_18860 [Cyclobacteriaceae bacterium YHN15]|nr:hypothetical protein EF405_18860 [Cyclobacteriaceae bacterium YHN15]